MTPSPMRDFLVGLFVLAGLGAIAYLSFSVGGLSYSGPGGLKLFAAFDQTGGLKTRAPVVIAGVKVGQVKDISLDKTYRARVEMDVDNRLKLPTDTTASIVTAGILGDRYISLQVGGDEQVLHSGDTLTFTESALILESLIGKFIYGRNSGGGGGGAGATSGGEEKSGEQKPEQQKPEQKKGS
jgi:phospholipid/cholesterol/gamma-HCH transport system substrate-binding protein